MRKFLAIVKHEYKKIVFTWAFLIGTLLPPLLASMFAIVPAMIFSIKGEPPRISVVDLTGGRVATRFKENLSPEKINRKAQQAAREAFKEINQSQEEQMKRNAQTVWRSFVFVDYDGGRKNNRANSRAS